MPELTRARHRFANAPTKSRVMSPMRHRARAVRFVARVAVLAGFVLSAMSCRGGSQRRGDDELLAARQTAALAWVNALGDGASLGRLSTDRLIVRNVGADRACEGEIAGKPAFEAWVKCVSARSDLREMAAWWSKFRDARPSSPESAALQRYLPHVVGTDDAWSRFVGVQERARAQAPFEALAKEAGKDGEWVLISGRGLSTSVVFRLQLVGAVASPRVHAVLVDVTRTD